MNIKQPIWSEQGGRFYLDQPSLEHKELLNEVYTVKQDDHGNFYLVHVCKTFLFDYKIYGLETKLINRFLKTYDHEKSGNLGLLLNGVKGTGKTVSSKIIANKLNQPTIVVSTPYKGVQYFLNSIPQNITIFIDEYEKIYGQSNDMLTIMDGAMNSNHRRVFLWTTNKLYIEDNLKQRPSRLRYIKKFEDLTPSVVEEIIDDILVHEEFREECIRFMTTLSLITVDIVKSVINEVNIHEESPFEFEDVFNVNKMEGKYKVFELDKTGKELGLLADNTKVYPRPNFDVDNHVGYWFEINGEEVGRVVNVLANDTIVVDIIDLNGNKQTVVETLYLKVEKTYGTHGNYAWTGGANVNNFKTEGRLETLMSDNKKRVENASEKHKQENAFQLGRSMEIKEASGPMSEDCGPMSEDCCDESC